MVFSNMRPPVAAEYGNSPLRGKSANKVFEIANGDYEDRAGFKVTKEQVVMNYTDDARLQDSAWDQRHHVTPSGFNTKNHTHYKVRRKNQGVGSYPYSGLWTAILREGLQEQ